jgi:hypothetical protein
MIFPSPSLHPLKDRSLRETRRGSIPLQAAVDFGDAGQIMIDPEQVRIAGAFGMIEDPEISAVMEDSRLASGLSWICMTPKRTSPSCALSMSPRPLGLMGKSEVQTS